MKWVAAIAIGSFGCGATASAQSADCACLLPAATGVLGQLTNLQGSVLVSGATGFEVAQAGQSLSTGTQVLAGPQAQATASFGSCSVDLAAGARLNVVSQNGGVCVQSSTLTASTPAQPSTGGETLTVSTQVGEEVILGGALGGGAAPVVIGTVVLGGGIIAAAASSSSP